MNWQPIETAPRDGTWILIEGEMSGGETSSVRLARWNPQEYIIGDQRIPYEWEALDDAYDPDEMWTHYSEGRVHSWRPLPDLPVPD